LANENTEVCPDNFATGNIQNLEDAAKAIDSAYGQFNEIFVNCCYTVGSFKSKEE
jgi:hypothetical protein